MLTLLLAHLAALALSWYAPRFWVWMDVRAFQADGAKDSLHQSFHAQRLTWRVAVLLLVTALASVPARHGGQWAFTASGVGLVAIGAAYFFYDFSPRLNRARNLPYVAAYYVSFDPRAALFPDRYLATQAVAALPELPGFDAARLLRLRQAWAAARLERLGVQVVEAGALLYLVLLFFTCLLL